MKPPRFSVAALMALVALVGVNLAVARGVYIWNTEILIGVTLTCLAVEWSIFRLIVRRSPSGAFWIGFAALGALAMGSFAWGMTLPRELHAVAYPGHPPRLVNVSSASAFWLGYGSYVFHCIEPWLTELPIDTDPDKLPAIMIRGLFWSLPQLLLAFAGGLIAWAIAQIIGARDPRDPNHGAFPTRSVLIGPAQEG
jgi:hypothetical protein